MFIMKCYKDLKKDQEAGKQLKLSEVHRLKWLLKDSQMTELNDIIEADEELNDIDSAFQMSFVNETYAEGLEELVELLIKDIELVREQAKRLLEENEELKEDRKFNFDNFDYDLVDDVDLKELTDEEKEELSASLEHCGFGKCVNLDSDRGCLNVISLNKN